MQTYQKNVFKNKIYNVVISIANWISSIPLKVTPPPFALMQMGSSIWQSRALYVACKLNIADALGDDIISADELASKITLNPDHLYRLMRMLASLGIFKEVSHREFKNSKMSNFLREDNPKNVKAMILMHNSNEMISPWIGPLEQSIRSGDTPFEKTHGVDLFEFMSRNSEFDSLFSRAMDSVEALTGDAFLQDFNWADFDRLIDVGGSKGSKSISILRSNPNIKALVMDRPSIIQQAKAFWQGRLDDSILSRMEFTGGDLLQSIPVSKSSSDLYLFAAVFHALSDQECLQTLKNLKTAMSNYSAKAVIADIVVDEEGADRNVTSFDMQMLISCKGKERTLTQWKLLFNQSGFELIEIVNARTFAKFLLIQPQVKSLE